MGAPRRTRRHPVASFAQSGVVSGAEHALPAIVEYLVQHTERVRSPPACLRLAGTLKTVELVEHQDRQHEPDRPVAPFQFVGDRGPADRDLLPGRRWAPTVIWELRGEKARTPR